MGMAFSPSWFAHLHFHLLGGNYHPKLDGAGRRCLEDFRHCNTSLRPPRRCAEEGYVCQRQWNTTSQCEAYESEVASWDWMEALGCERVLAIRSEISSHTSADGMEGIIENLFDG